MIEVILISADGGIDLSRWREVRRASAHLEPIEDFHETNPFTRVTKTVATPDSASVIADGLCIGQLFWDEGRLVSPLEFDEHRPRLEQVAQDVASQLAGAVSIVDDDDLNLKPRD